MSTHANVLSYGTGTFEGIRAGWNDDHDQLYLLEARAHYERMARSARVLGLELPYGTEELIATSAELLRRNEIRSDAYLRPLYVLAGDELPVRIDGVPTRFQVAVTPIVGDYIDLAACAARSARGGAPPMTSCPAARSCAAATWARRWPRARPSPAVTMRP